MRIQNDYCPMECSALAPPYILQSRLVCSGLASLVRLFYSAVIVTACLKNSPHPHKTKRRSAKIRRTWQASIIVVIRDVGDGWAGWTIAHPCFGRSVNSISTIGGRLCPPHYFLPTQLWVASYGTGLKKECESCTSILQLPKTPTCTVGKRTDV